VKCAWFNGERGRERLLSGLLPDGKKSAMHQVNGALKWMWLAICCGSLAAAAVPAAGRDDSLYGRLGGTANVTAFVADTIDHAASDPHLKLTFEGVNLGRVKGHFVEMVCELTGGGCKYSGDSMHDAHAGLGATESQFYVLVQLLRDSMRRHGVPLSARNELLQILAPMKRDIVER
jgi:hemoglobin